MVVNVGQLKQREYGQVFHDISIVAEMCRRNPQRVTLKVILETSLLTRDEIVAGCVISREAGADYVKTSTGFSTGGAKPQDVHLMKHVFRGKVKASGGIRTLADARTMIAAGADRLGCSASVSIVQALQKELTDHASNWVEKRIEATQ
jgi:deoxyribose-phosphate aldolase